MHHFKMFFACSVEIILPVNLNLTNREEDVTVVCVGYMWKIIKILNAALEDIQDPFNRELKSPGMVFNGKTFTL